MHELEVVVELAREAGELLRAEAARDGGPRGAGYKAPVDDEICALLVERLGAAFPRDTIRSEELPVRHGDSGRTFEIDPHDGTSHFLRGSRDTSISIGLVEDGRHLLGVVYAPVANELTGPDGLLVDWAVGQPLRRNGAPVEPRADAPEALSGSCVVLVSPNMRAEVRAWNERTVAPARLVGCGSVATRAALVALGEASGWHTLRNALSTWDYAAGQALMDAAGGTLVDGDGEEVTWQGCEPTRLVMDFFGARSPSLAQDLAARFRAAFRALGGD
jgi:fructose-1,6-bisphosphatase/inositol monophosphatase family enzyme